MKTGKTLIELATELERQKAAKRDFVAPAEKLLLNSSIPEKAAISSLTVGTETFGVNDFAHDQIANRLEIPRKYYDKMRTEAPHLLDKNVNHWFSKHDDAMLVRTMDGKARALLSSRYRPLDNADLAEAVLPVLSTMSLEIISCEITEKRFYLKAVDKGILKDIPTGKKLGQDHVFFDTVSPAIIISNSEVGAGALSVETGVWTKLCTNLAIAAERAMRKYHVGSKTQGGEDFYELLSDKTRALSDAAVWAQTRDLVKAAFDRAKFDALAEKLIAATGEKIKAEPIAVIEVTAKKFGFTEGEKNSVLTHLLTGGDLSKYGLHSAVTRTAEDLKDYDRATEFERLGGEIIELSKGDWEVIANAA